MVVERWTDEMLDELASSVERVNDSVDGLRITAQALLQVAAQNQRKMEQFEQEIELMKQRHSEEIDLIKQRQAENDERFNVLLEEVRYLIRGNKED
jgi:fumarate hydratase class II